MGRREGHVLLATVGNIFLGDDGFGPDVAVALARREHPEGIVVRDFGIRVFDLELALEKAEAAVIVDVVRRPAAPGTLVVLSPDPSPEDPVVTAPGHATTSTDVVLRFLARSRRGETPRALRLVGVVPETFGDPDEGALGLSEAVAAAVERAADLALETACTLAEEVLSKEHGT